MRYAKRSAIALPSTILLITLLACGGSLLASLRIALAASGPLIDSLVAAGAVSGALASDLRTDFGDGVGCASGLETDFKAIPPNATDKKARKLNASVKGARCFKVIVDRQHFSQNPRTRQISGIVDGIFASLVVFYSEPGPMRASTVGRATAISAKDENELEKSLSKQVDQLKAAMKP